MAALGWLCAVFAGLWVLGILLSRHIQGLILLLSGSPRIATALYDLLVLPGVVLHELSHALIALLLGLRVVRINLFQFRSQNDVRQGEVVVTKADPLRMSLVGAAPLFGGVAAIVLLVAWLAPPALGLDVAVLGQLRLLLGDLRSAVVLYLLFAIANTMFPSEADREAWWVVGVAAVIGVLAIFALGIQPTIPPRWMLTLTTQADRLVTALLPVVLLDVACLAIVLVFETLIGRLRGRRVVYRSSKL
jgi:hypothetical protein